MRQRALITLITLVFLLGTAAFTGAAVNKSIRVDDGETVDRGLSSVNGSITVGARADLQRRAETVNGRISVDDESRTRDLSSVNGTVRIGERVTVDGDLSSVNGAIRVGQDAVVMGSVETVNGGIELNGTTVHEDLQTINGRVVLDHGSRVQGDLIIEGGNRRDWDRPKPLEIELRDGSVIEGDLDVRDEDRKVTVRLSGGAAVMGQVRGAELIQE